MFLDPDPKQQKASGSGFFSSQRPIVSPRDSAPSWRRKPLPLSQRSHSENNRQNQGEDTLKPTVRLVKPLPPEPLETSHIGEDGDDISRKENGKDAQHVEQSTSPPADDVENSLLKPGSSYFADSGQEFQVSDVHTPTNEAQNPTKARRDNRLSSLTGNDISKTQWPRRSASPGNYSTSSTLRESDIQYGPKSLRSESRTSEGTTLRGTPTPSELEQRDRSVIEEDSSQLSLNTTLPSVEEASPERSTVRLISTPRRFVSGEDKAASDTSNSTAEPQRISLTDPAVQPSFPEQISPEHSSTSSLPTTPNLQHFDSFATLRNQQSRESVARSEAAWPTSSSPNVVAFCSDSPRPRSLSHPLYTAASLESIQSRLQSSTVVRPGTGHSAATQTSWASRPASSDTPPPLHVPKKRLRHKAASSSLSAAAAASAGSANTMNAEEDIDTQPYPRQIFSSHLSTIASESDPQSRSGSQHLSHFSLGSAVWTGDESSSNPLSGVWPPRNGSVDVEPLIELSPAQPTSSGEEEHGDMTLGVFREESALPQPLFHVRSPSAPPTSHPSGSPFLPMPPSPRSRDSEENFDTVGELIPPHQLREQRSAHSLRRRSHSTPSRRHSRQISQASESSRWSQGVGEFPSWTKAYYVYGAALLSSSQISLSSPMETQKLPSVHHYVFNRNWSERSITSRLGSEYSDLEPTSPASSHFLPSVFRPWNRKSGTVKKLKKKAGRPSPPSNEQSPDSMMIASAAATGGKVNNPPQQPAYGSLKDNAGQHRPLPRRYSKQRKWDEMEFPRPMSKDLLDDYRAGPRLVPSKRIGQRMPKWRAPSFAEGLDTLLRSRCNRQILLFALGFVCPLCWIIASFLPLPKKPLSLSEYENAQGLASVDDVQVAMVKHEAGDAETRRWEERQWMKARWWRYLNRIMSVVGVLVIAAVIALAIVAANM